MVQEQVFSFLNKIKSLRVTDAELLSLSKLSSFSDQTPILNTDAIEFYSLFEKKGIFPLNFFINSLSKEQQDSLLQKFTLALNSEKPKSFFIGLGLLRGAGKRTGPALLLPTKFNPETLELTPNGLPIENPAMAELEGFPEPETALVDKVFSIKEYFRRLKLFIASQEDWKFTEKGICILLFPKKSIYETARISRIFRDQDSERISNLSRELLGGEFDESGESSFEASRFNKTFQPAEHAFLYPMDSEDTDALLHSLEEETKYFVLQPLPGTDNGKTVSNLIAEALYKQKKTAVIASHSTSLQIVKDALIQPSFSDEKPDFETLANNLKSTRQVFEKYYSLTQREGNDTTPLADILQELSKNKKKCCYRLGAKIAEIFDNLSLEECKATANALGEILKFKAQENSAEKESFFSLLNERAFNNANFARKLSAIVNFCDSWKIIIDNLKEASIINNKHTIENIQKITKEVVEILSKNFLDFPNWNLKGQEWDSFKDTIQTFTSAAKVWTDYRNQGSGDFTPSAIDTNITRAKELFAEYRTKKMKHMSENYLSSKKILKSILRDPKLATNDEVLLKYAEKLWEIQECRNTYKNNSALAQRLFGDDWNYEQTDWERLEKKINAFYRHREKIGQDLKLNVLAHAYKLNNYQKELTEFISALEVYQTLLQDFVFFITPKGLPKEFLPQTEIVYGLMKYLEDLPSYENTAKGITTLKNFKLDILLQEKSILQDPNAPEKLIQAWLSGNVQKIAKESAEIFSKNSKSRIKDSKAYRKAYDMWLQANSLRVTNTLKENPDILQFALAESLVSSPHCDLLIILDAETIPVTDFLIYARYAKKIILVGDEHLPSGHIDSSSILVHALRLGVPQRNISFAFGHRHPFILQFASSVFYDNSIRTFPLPDTSRERPYRKHVSDNPKQKLVKAILEHAKTNPARTLGVIAFATEEIQTLQQLLQNALKDLPNLAQFFKKRTYRNTFYISSPENAIGQKRDTIFVLTESVTQGALASPTRINACASLAEREIHFFISDHASFSAGETGKLFQSFLDFTPSEKQNPNLQEPSPILTELHKLADEKSILTRQNIGQDSVTVALAVVDENNSKRYLLAAEDDSLSGSLQHSIEDREYMRPKSAEMLGWKIVRIWTPTWYLFNDDEKNHFLTTVSIEQSIAPPKVETESDDEKDDSESTYASLIVPYQIKHPKITGAAYGQSIPELSIKELIHQLLFYVETESPIHEKQLLFRMLTLHKVQKPGPKILQILQEGLKIGLQQKLFVKTGPFFYSRNQKTIQPRYRGDLPDAERLLQYVSPEERSQLPSDEATLKEALGLL
ncbi:MAG: hypothetical protein IIU83_04010 [Fibrobacteraceae bacterium]|nr:hypothetical protein [Fibrobacteraceae bacterium]